MVDIIMGHRANDRQFVCTRGELRQVLANLQARHARLNWLKFTPIFCGGEGLHVPGVLMRRSTPHE
jgi:hypothetical protein